MLLRFSFLQVLFQAEFPKVLCRLGSFEIDTDGIADSDFLPSSFMPQEQGPFERSFDSARRIFSSGRSLVGAGGWAGWGLTGPQYQANELVSLTTIAEIDQLIDRSVEALVKPLLKRVDKDLRNASDEERQVVFDKCALEIVIARRGEECLYE